MLQSSKTRSNRGFSLTEVTITLGIVAAALLPMVAMLGGGSALQRESEDLSKAGFISLSVMEQLSLSSDIVGVVAGSTEPEIETFEIPEGDGELRIMAGVDFQGQVLRLLSKEEYENGISSDTDIFYLVTISIQETDSGHASETGAADLFRTLVSIEQPASAIERNRHKYPFLTFLALEQ